MSNIVTVDLDLPHIRLHQFDEQGRLTGWSHRTASRAADSDGLAEVSPDSMRECILAALAECVTISGETPEILIVTGNDEGLALIDEQGAFIRPIIIGDDLRALPVVEHWIETGIAAAGFRVSGSVAKPSSTVALLRVLQESEPATLETARLASGPVGALSHLLSGDSSLPITLAPLPVVDPYRATLDEELVDLYRLRGMRSLLPAVGSIARPLEPSAGWTSIRELMNKEATVAVGLPQIIAAMTASGALETRQSHIHLGPSLLCATAVYRLDSGAEPGGITLCTRRRDHWIRSIDTSVGLRYLDWLLGLTGSSYQALNALVEASPPGAGGVITVPMASRSGEWGLYCDPFARGRITGFHNGATSADLARSACEGIAFAARAALSAAGDSSIEPVHFTGAGVKAPAFRRLLADILERPVLVHADAEPVARGAALAALCDSTAGVDREHWIAPADVIEPDPQRTRFYEDWYSQFQAEMVAGRRVGKR